MPDRPLDFPKEVGGALKVNEGSAGKPKDGDPRAADGLADHFACDITHHPSPGYNLTSRGFQINRTHEERHMALTKADYVSEETYRRLALGDPQGLLELHNGQLRERPGMSAAHGDVMDLLLDQLYRQLDRGEYRLRVQHARLRLSSDTYYVPDITVIPIAYRNALLEIPRSLDAYPDPLPLVVEIWSPSTGDYDVNEKLADYQRRGDAEIWRVHPYERTLTAWRRQPDGTYVETIYRDGLVHPQSLPGVTINLEALFET